MRMLITRNIVQRIAVFSASISAILLSCYSLKSNKNAQKQIESLSLYSRLQIVDLETGKIGEVFDSLTVVYAKNFTIYKVAVPHSYSSIIFDSTGNMVGEKYLAAGIDYRYYVHKRGDSLIYWSNSLNEQTRTPLPQAKFVNSHPILSINKFYDRENDSLVNIIKEKGKTIHAYIPKRKFDESYNDTTYLYFSENPPSKYFYFSKELEEREKKQIVKVVFVYNPLENVLARISVPKRQFTFELKPVPGDSISTILNFIKTVN